MPVSSPSYFPAQRSNRSIVGTTAGQQTLSPRSFLAGNSAGKFTGILVTDLQVIGDGAFSAGTAGTPVTNAALANSTFIGSNAGAALNGPSSNVPVTDLEGVLIIGGQAGKLLQKLDTSVIVGPHAVETMTGTVANTATKMVVIGSYAMNATPSVPADNMVAIGYRCMDGAYTSLVNNTIIGSQCGSQGSQSFTGNVVIGASACLQPAGATSGNVIIGQSSCIGAVASAQDNVIIGQGTSVTTGTENVAVGKSANAASGTRNVLLGVLNDAALGGSRNILLGYRAALNTGYNGAQNDRFIVGTINNCHVFGVMSNGNMIVGNSASADQADLFAGTAGTNNFKLTNGTPPTAAPTGGGLAYTATGALHWVGTDGSDNVLSGGTITPSALGAGSTDNYAPAGFADCNTIRQAVNALGSTLTGLAGGVDGKTVTIENISTGAAQLLTFNHEDAGSTAANRFTLPAAGNNTISNISSATFRYDGASSRWRLLSSAG